MKRLSLSRCLVILVLFVAAPGHAALIDNGYDSNGNHLIYDTDLNLTWYDAPAVPMHWNQAMSWAASLSIAGTAAGSWRLPINLPVNGISYTYSWSGNGSTDQSANITSRNSEMGHLFNVELGNKSCWALDGSLIGWTPFPDVTIKPGYGLTNKGPFINLQADYYWYGIEYENTPGDAAWIFNFREGEQVGAYKDTGVGRPFVLAVHPGDVLSNGVVLPNGPPVPEPATLLLFGFGLLGFVVLRKKFNGYRKSI